jgi:hypothetical protein
MNPPPVMLYQKLNIMENILCETLRFLCETLRNS